MSKKWRNVDISASYGQYLQQGRIPINAVPAVLLTYQDPICSNVRRYPEAVWLSDTCIRQELDLDVRLDEDQLRQLLRVDPAG